MPKLPACSSREVANALKRLGFKPGHGQGSHQTWTRERGGVRDTTVIVLGEKEIDRYTLGNVLKLGNISEAEFLGALRRPPKGAR